MNKHDEVLDQLNAMDKKLAEMQRKLDEIIYRLPAPYVETWGPTDATVYTFERMQEATK